MGPNSPGWNGEGFGWNQPFMPDAGGGSGTPSTPNNPVFYPPIYDNPEPPNLDSTPPWWQNPIYIPIGTGGGGGGTTVPTVPTTTPTTTGTAPAGTTQAPRQQGSNMGTALLWGGLASGVGSIISSLIGANAAGNAADTQAASAQKAIDYAKELYGQNKTAQQPYMDTGATSLGQLMAGIKNGTFGASVGEVPTFQKPGAFTAPTLEEARATPGYEFTAQQGNKGILQGSAAAGGAISGGTLKALD